MYLFVGFIMFIQTINLHNVRKKFIFVVERKDF